ncbi:CinA family protein [Candidatus Margulisiibacteriota bacterium]
MTTIKEKVKNIKPFQHELDLAVVELDTRLDWDISRLLTKRGYTLSVSETITAGLISNRLSRYAKNKNYFYGGIISCHPIIKINICSVSPATLREYGVASSQTVLEMVRGLKKITKTNICIAVSGMILNREGVKPEQAKAVKNVFMAFDFNGKETLKSFYIEGNEETLKNTMTQATLVQLKQLLIKKESEI